MSLTLDTSGLLALLNTRDTNHASCVEALRHDIGPYFISIAIMSEIAWFLEDHRRFSSRVEQVVLNDIRAGAYMLDWASEDIDRIQTLVERYRDLGLGLADAAVIACAERHGGRILTTDTRHFSVVARGEHHITVLPH